MKTDRFALPLLFLLILTATVWANDDTSLAPRAKDGKKLLTAIDLMKVATVSAPRISPDGTRVVYTVSETKTEKDKEWKSVSQVWVVQTAGGEARQYTRGEKNSEVSQREVTYRPGMEHDRRNQQDCQSIPVAAHPRHRRERA